MKIIPKINLRKSIYSKQNLLIQSKKKRIKNYMIINIISIIFINIILFLISTFPIIDFNTLNIILNTLNKII